MLQVQAGHQDGWRGAAPGRDGGLGNRWFAAGAGPDGKAPSLLFTENETDARELFGVENPTPYVKDAFPGI